MAQSVLQVQLEIQGLQVTRAQLALQVQTGQTVSMAQSALQDQQGLPVQQLLHQ